MQTPFNGFSSPLARFFPALSSFGFYSTLPIVSAVFSAVLVLVLSLFLSVSLSLAMFCGYRVLRLSSCSSLLLSSCSGHAVVRGASNFFLVSPAICSALLRNTLLHPSASSAARAMHALRSQLRMAQRSKQRSKHGLQPPSQQRSAQHPSTAHNSTNPQPRKHNHQPHDKQPSPQQRQNNKNKPHNTPHNTTHSRYQPQTPHSTPTQNHDIQYTITRVIVYCISWFCVGVECGVCGWYLLCVVLCGVLCGLFLLFCLCWGDGCLSWGWWLCLRGWGLVLLCAVLGCCAERCWLGGWRPCLLRCLLR